MNRTEILDKANEYITRDRQATHGEAENSFADIAGLWSAYLHKEINPRDVAMMMVIAQRKMLILPYYLWPILQLQKLP